MSNSKKQTSSQTALLPVEPGNIFGTDPHRKTLTATVLDCRGGILGTEVFRVSGDGHRAMEAWALGFGPILRWGVEGASGVGRHTAMFLALRGHDVRDVCPNRTNERRRSRQSGKTDASDSVRIARETQAEPGLPLAFKRAGTDSGPDETVELIALWHKARRSLVATRQHLLGEADNLIAELPDDLRAALPDTNDVRTRLKAIADLIGSPLDPPNSLRLRLLVEHRRMITELDSRERQILKELRVLIATSGSTLGELPGLAERSVAELLVEIGDPRRFTGGGGFARFNGTAPLPASSAEGNEQPRRHRLNRGGNRRVNSVLHIMAVTQLRCNDQAKTIYANARTRGHTKKECMRIVKRHLSDVVYRRMMQDLNRRLEGGTLQAA